MTDRLRILVWRSSIFISFAGVWEAASRTSAKVLFLVASPSTIINALKGMAQDGSLWIGILATGEEASAGLVIGTLLGSVLGLSFWLSERAASIAKPFILVASTLPVFSVAPLLIVWFGIGMKMKIALATLATVFVAFNQGHRGAQSVSGELVEILRGLTATRRQIFVKIVVPGAFDWVLSSMRLNVGFSLLGAFIGEFIAADRGLGYEIMKASGLYNVPRALAAAICISALALGFDRLAALVEDNRHSLIQLLSVPRLIWDRGTR